MNILQDNKIRVFSGPNFKIHVIPFFVRSQARCTTDTLFIFSFIFLSLYLLIISR